MSDALTYIYYIYDKFIDLVFNKLEFFTNVTVGWVVIGCLIFGVLIKSLLALPRSAPTYQTNASIYHNADRRDRITERIQKRKSDRASNWAIARRPPWKRR